MVSLAERILDFGALTQQPVLSWWNTLVGSIGDHLMEDPNRSGDLQHLRGRHAELKSSFVAGAPGHLLVNICPVKGYANGTPVIYHSLRFGSQEDKDQADTRIEEWQTLYRADPSRAARTEVMIPVPEAINVQVPSVAATEQNVSERVDTADCLFSKRVEGQTDSELVLGQCVVIPVPLLHRLPSGGKRRFFTLELPRSVASCSSTTRNMKQKRTNPLNYQMHPVTVAFALTFHKLCTRPNSKQVDTQLEPSPSRDESPVPQKLLRWILSCQEPQWFAIFAHDRQGTQAVRSPVEQET